MCPADNLKGHFLFPFLCRGEIHSTLSYTHTGTRSGKRYGHLFIHYSLKDQFSLADNDDNEAVVYLECGTFDTISILIQFNRFIFFKKAKISSLRN